MNNLPKRAKCSRQKPVALLLTLLFVVAGFSLFFHSTGVNPEDANDVDFLVFGALKVVSVWDSGAALQDEKSPQFKAYEWIRKDPFLRSFESAQMLQRYALATFYYSTGGEGNWNQVDNWLFYGNDECSWEGITCKNGDVTEMSLSRKNLSGTVPPELILLNDSLFYLDLEGNNLEMNKKEITFFGELTNLDTLALGDGNKIKSKGLPKSFNQLNLFEFSISNGISGEFSDIVDTLADMMNLEYLDLENNKIFGSVPTNIGDLWPNLAQLYIAENAISGDLSFVSNRNLSDISVLRVFSNYISGTIPSQIASLTNLETLDLFYCDLSGTIPPALGNLDHLDDLVVSANMLKGEMPSTICDLRLSTLSSNCRVDCDCCTETCYDQ